MARTSRLDWVASLGDSFERDSFSWWVQRIQSNINSFQTELLIIGLYNDWFNLKKQWFPYSLIYNGITCLDFQHHSLAVPIHTYLRESLTDYFAYNFKLPNCIPRKLIAFQRIVSALISLMIFMLRNLQIKVSFSSHFPAKHIWLK